MNVHRDKNSQMKATRMFSVSMFKKKKKRLTM